MKRLLHTLSAIFLFTLVGFAQTGDLPRATPESQGVSSKFLLQMLDTLMGQTDTDIHGIMILRHGKVIAEKYRSPWAAPYGHTLYSCSKTFTAVAVGLAVQDSLIALDTRLSDVLPDMLPAVPSDSLLSITVYDLLTMRSGLPVDTEMRTKVRNWTRTYLSHAPSSAPGTNFAYDSIDTYLLSAIVQRVTGKTIMQLLQEHIFTPMHIQQAYWEESPEGISCGGWGLYLQLESMAKFGQLLAQKGSWSGSQLVDREWVDLMLTKHVDCPNGTKYGLHIWQCPYPDLWRADGAYGQYIYVMPEHDIVVAITQCMRGNGNLEHKWVNKLALASSSSTVTAEPLTQKMLADKEYMMPYTKGKDKSSQHVAPFVVDLGNNDLGWRTLKITQENNLLQVNVTTTTGRTFPLQCGYQRWLLNAIDGKPLNFRAFKNEFSNIPEPFLVSASYGWTTPDDLYLRLHFVNWLTSCRLHINLKKNNVGGDILLGYTNKLVDVKVYLK